MILGMIGVSSGLAGYFMGRANIVERVLLLAAGITLIYPNIWVSLVGLVVLVAVALIQRLRKATTTTEIAAQRAAATA